MVLTRRMAGCGSRLVLRDGRRGTAAALRQLVADTGATAVYFNRVRRPGSAIFHLSFL